MKLNRQLYKNELFIILNRQHIDKSMSSDMKEAVIAIRFKL